MCVCVCVCVFRKNWFVWFVSMLDLYLNGVITGQMKVNVLQEVIQ